MERYACAALAAFVVLSVGPALCAPLRVPFEDLRNVELSFDLGAGLPEWSLQTQDKVSASYVAQGCSLELKIEKRGMQRILRLRLAPPAGQKLAVTSYEASLSVPTAGLHSVMVPNVRRIGEQLNYYHQNKKWRENVPLYRCLVPEGFEQQALTNTDAPFILLCDNNGNNAFSVGWARAAAATVLKGEPRDSGYVLALLRREDQPFSGDALEDALIVTSARKPWIDVEREYARAFDGYNGRNRPAPPEWSTEPHFCTWYCYLEKINEEIVLKAARKCKELGIGVFVIDAGWDAKPGSWWGDLEGGTIGDYAAAPDRFPNMRRTVDAMHEMGLKVILWAAPFWQAKQSKVYLEKTKNWHAWTEHGERHELCPKYPGTRELFREQFERMARDYGIDGVWLDVADSVPEKCLAKHEHLDQTMGEAWVDCMAAIHDGLRSVNPEAVTEARILHANINAKTVLDVVQCGDSPETFEMIRLANLHLRPWAYNVTLKTDPTIWPRGSGAATVGEYMATMVCSGAPDVSVDFLTAPEQDFRITKAWLAFYKAHKNTLLKGRFRLFGRDYGIPDMMFIGKREAIVYLKDAGTSEVAVPRGIRKVFLINCTESDTVNLRLSLAEGRYAAQPFKPDWTKKGGPQSLVSDGKLLFSMSVPQGGAAVVERL